MIFIFSVRCIFGTIVVLVLKTNILKMKYSSLLASLSFLIALGSCDEEDACPNVYEPVCGGDGITYGNECYALAEGVKEWTQGECNVAVCAEIWMPVCGSDGNTYSNSCFAEAAGIEDYSMGECAN